MAPFGPYLQDWLLLDTDWNWRLEPELGGSLRAVADIGSHWMDLTSHIAGQRIVSGMADLKTFIPICQQPVGPVQTFATGHSGATTARTITTEDAATILLRFENGAIGNLTLSAGRKNTLEFEIDGSTSAAAWNSEHPDDLWIGHRRRPNEVLPRDPALLNAEGRDAASLPAGHNEGFADTFKALYRRSTARWQATVRPSQTIRRWPMGTSRRSSARQSPAAPVRAPGRK